MAYEEKMPIFPIELTKSPPHASPYNNRPNDPNPHHQFSRQIRARPQEPPSQEIGSPIELGPSDNDRTPILRRTPRQPLTPRRNNGYAMETQGRMSMDTFKCVYAVLAVLYSILNVGVWISLGLTIFFLEESSAYFVAVLVLASQMIIPMAQCSSIASSVKSVQYKHSARMGLQTLVNLHLVFLTFQLLSSLTCVGISVFYYEEYRPRYWYSSSEAHVTGMVNACMSSVVTIVTIINLTFDIKLKRSLNN